MTSVNRKCICEHFAQVRVVTGSPTHMPTHSGSPLYFQRTMNFLVAFGALVAVSAPAASQQCNIPGECVGNIFGATYENSVTDCLSSCQGASECEWFTFNSDGGYCGLQTTCDTIDADSCSSCISGAVFERTCVLSPVAELFCQTLMKVV